MIIEEGITEIDIRDYANERVLVFPASLLVHPEFDEDSLIREIDASKCVNITSIPAFAFYGTQLRRYICPPNLNEIGDSAFSRSKIRNIKITAAGNLDIGNYVFLECEDLQLIEIIGATQIGDRICDNCPNLRGANFSMCTFQVLSESTFRYCSRLQLVYLPQTCRIIENDAFLLCHALKTIKGGRNNNMSIGESAFVECRALQNLPWSSFSLIENYAFADCTALSELNIEVEFSIMESTFENCTNIQTARIRCPELNNNAFKSCYNLKSVQTTALKIGRECFEQCTKLIDFQAPLITNIGARAFLNCIKLKVVDFPMSLIVVGYEAFLNCRELVSLRGGSLLRIGENAFKGCTKLGSNKQMPFALGVEPDASIEYGTLEFCSSFFYYMPSLNIEFNNDMANAAQFAKSLFRFLSRDVVPNVPYEVVLQIQQSIDDDTLEYLERAVAE